MSGLFVTSRMASSRLPGKALASVCGRPMLELQIERVRTAKGVSPLVLCTTWDPEDDVLAELARANSVECYRGPTVDVLSRFLGAAESLSISTFVVSEGDSPFCEPSLIAAVAEILESGSADFVKVVGMPFGTFPYGLRTDALRHICEIKDEEDTEGWGRYFTTGLFRVTEVPAPAKWAGLDYRMTVDYEEDLAFVRAVYGRLYSSGLPLDLDEVFDLLREEPSIPELNARMQKVWLSRFSNKYSHVRFKNNHT